MAGSIRMSILVLRNCTFLSGSDSWKQQKDYLSWSRNTTRKKESSYETEKEPIHDWS